MSPSPGTRWRAVGAGALLLLGGAACSVLNPPQRPLQRHMTFHFAEVAKVREALADGNLEAAREPARAIWLQTDHPDLPRGVDSPVHDLRRSAHRAAAASTLEEAAEATAAMGAACARCHGAAGGGPRLAPAFAPLATSDAERMTRHVWAAERLWEGVVGDDDEVWRAGAMALADAPLVPSDGAGSDQVATMARQVHDLAAEAQRVQSAPARAGLYGRLLTTCSGCHERLGRWTAR